ncbi:MAG: hypothetical protein ACKV2T_13065 [Kofleriaceae bacterium]
MRHLGKVSIALALLVSACNMYGAKAPRVKNPVPIQQKIDKNAEPPVVVIKEIEECEYYERDMPVPARSAKTGQLEESGDARSKVFKSSTDVTVQKDALIDVIDSYGRALASDPFNPTLTLKLALAYDKAYRKGCALALLKRLSRLSNNGKFSAKAQPVVNEVLDRKDYFPRYRKAAVDAVGR